MSVLGIGLDLCPIDRMKQAIDRHGDRFLRRIFTPAERAYAEEAVGGMAQSLAARFAAKEAASKSIGAPKGIGWHDVEVVPARKGLEGPRLILRGRAQEVADARGVKTIMVSLTHAGGVAAAVAVAVA
ncbi:MAG: holo-ACP synthase [Myxococcota bacterium]